MTAPAALPPHPAIVMVAAVARNGVIGADNRLLWRIRRDLRHFRALTMGKAVIVGRKTYESIGKPLPGRHMIVITRDAAWHQEGVEPVASPHAALERARVFSKQAGTGEVMIAGGGEIYSAFLPLADRLEITAVDLSPDGDAHFPPIDPALWRVETRRSFAKSVDDDAAFDLISYVRR